MKLVARTSVVLLMGLSVGVLAFQRRVPAVLRASSPGLWRYETAGDSKHEFAWSRLRYNPSELWRVRIRLRWRRVVEGLSQGRHHVSRGSPAPDPDRCPELPAGRQSGPRRHLQLSLRVRRPGRSLDVQRGAGQAPARVPVEGRLPHGGRFPWHRRLGKLPAEACGWCCRPSAYPITDLADGDEIFHVLYDIGQRFQVPGEQYVQTGRTYEKDGYVPKWRAIRDDKGRVIVAICHNMHLGDAWEWADDSPSIRRRLPRWRFASASTTSCTA